MVLFLGPNSPDAAVASLVKKMEEEKKSVFF